MKGCGSLVAVGLGLIALVLVVFLLVGCAPEPNPRAEWVERCSKSHTESRLVPKAGSTLADGPAVGGMRMKRVTVCDQYELVCVPGTEEPCPALGKVVSPVTGREFEPERVQP